MPTGAEEYKHKEAALATREREFHQMVDSVPLHIVLLDADFRQSYGNTASRS